MPDLWKVMGCITVGRCIKVLACKHVFRAVRVNM